MSAKKQINGIQEDIESAAGRVNYLVHSSAYSTINLKYYQYLNGITAKEAEPTLITKIGDAFKTGGSIITNIVLFIVSIWPIIVAAFFVLLYVMRRRGTKAVKQVNQHTG